MSQGQMQYPDPEVTPKAKRRRFSAEYKLRALAEMYRSVESVCSSQALPWR